MCVNQRNNFFHVQRYYDDLLPMMSETLRRDVSVYINYSWTRAVPLFDSHDVNERQEFVSAITMSLTRQVRGALATPARARARLRVAPRAGVRAARVRLPHRRARHDDVHCALRHGQQRVALAELYGVFWNRACSDEWWWPVVHTTSAAGVCPPGWQAVLGCSRAVVSECPRDSAGACARVDSAHVMGSVCVCVSVGSVRVRRLGAFVTSVANRTGSAV